LNTKTKRLANIIIEKITINEQPYELVNRRTEKRLIKCPREHQFRLILFLGLAWTTFYTK